MIATASTGATARPAAAEDVTVAAVSASHALRSSESGDSDRASMDERAGDAGRSRSRSHYVGGGGHFEETKVHMH